MLNAGSGSGGDGFSLDLASLGTRSSAGVGIALLSRGLLQLRRSPVASGREGLVSHGAHSVVTVVVIIVTLAALL
jgi:hypothetical protein